MSTHYQSLFIDGGWRKPASSKRLEVVSATTEEVIGSVPEGSEPDIDAAVAAARRAFEQGPWSTYTSAERGAALIRFADAIEKRATQLAQSVSMQNGMPINVADQLESGYGVGVLRYYAALAGGLNSEERRPVSTRLDHSGASRSDRRRWSHRAMEFSCGAFHHEIRSSVGRGLYCRPKTLARNGLGLLYSR